MCDYKFQLSIKNKDGDLLNVTANTADEFDKNLSDGIRISNKHLATLSSKKESAASNTPASSTSPAKTPEKDPFIPVKCPYCGNNKFEDQRRNKKYERGPDWKCTGCKAAAWIPKKGGTELFWKSEK
jgi:hypothetical protein